MSSIRALVIVFFAAASVQAVTIDMVTVGNPGNAADTRYDLTGFGSVGYNYQIGKYEVTAGQYTEFLNAVAKADPNGLYNTNMLNTFGAQIQRIGSSPNFSYWVPADGANRPVNFVGFWDVVRFANWLHNGQPIGAQGPSTTEGGAYNAVGNPMECRRTASAIFFIPSEDEWYKAAYHMNDGVTGNYWVYPTASNTTPINTLPDPGNHANYYDNGHAIGSPYYRSEAGAFNNSSSPYGTFDQGGNVVEWNDTRYSNILGTRGRRGGSFYDSSSNMRSSSRGASSPLNEFFYVGFRVASIAVPEPSTMFLVPIAFATLSVRRRHRPTQQPH